MISFGLSTNVGPGRYPLRVVPSHPDVAGPLSTLAAYAEVRGPCSKSIGTIVRYNTYAGAGWQLVKRYTQLQQVAEPLSMLAACALHG